MDKHFLSNYIKDLSEELGFSACGISPVMNSENDVLYLNDWINKGYHAGMNWISQSIPLRSDPSLLLTDVKSVVVFAFNYYSPEGFVKTDFQISKYALNQDYHWVLKNKLKQLFESIKTLDSLVEGRCFVDSGPIFEKSYAVNAGLGWIGKNSCLILPQKGSFFFLATLLLNVELEYDQPFLKNHCGKCTKCIDACPTGAIKSPFVIDSNKCISYLTIEHKGEIPSNVDFKNTKQIFGCDICQNVCPHNRLITNTSEKGFMPSVPCSAMNDNDWENLSKSDFKKQFKYSPIQRAGYEKIKSNIAYIMGNDI